MTSMSGSPAVCQLAHDPLDEFVDGADGVGAEVAARLPAAFDDGLGSCVRRVVGHPRVVILRGGDVFTLGRGS